MFFEPVTKRTLEVRTLKFCTFKKEFPVVPNVRLRSKRNCMVYECTSHNNEGEISNFTFECSNFNRRMNNLEFFYHTMNN